MEIHLITVKSSSFDGLFLWRLNFNRSGLNFNAASHLTLMAQPQFEDVLYDNPIL